MKLNPLIVKDAMDRKTVDQDEMAEKLEMSIATVNNAINGGECYRSTAKAICEFLDIEPADAMVSRVSKDRGDAA